MKQVKKDQLSKQINRVKNIFLLEEEKFLNLIELLRRLKASIWTLRSAEGLTEEAFKTQVDLILSKKDRVGVVAVMYIFYLAKSHYRTLDEFKGWALRKFGVDGKLPDIMSARIPHFVQYIKRNVVSKGLKRKDLVGGTRKTTQQFMKKAKKLAKKSFAVQENADQVIQRLSQDDSQSPVEVLRNNQEPETVKDYFFFFFS